MPIIKFAVKRERFILCLTIILIILFIVYNFAVSLKNRYISAQTALTKKELLLRKNLKILDTKKTLEADYARLTGYIREVKSDEKELTALLKDVESLASESGLHIINLKPRGARKERFYKSYEVELDCEFNIKQLTQFLTHIDNDPSLLKIKRFHLSAKENALSTLKANISIARIVFPPNLKDKR